MRGEQVFRLWRTAEFIAELRFGETLVEINRTMNARVGVCVHWRTTKRDLQLLVSLGFAERVEIAGRTRWRFNRVCRSPLLLRSEPPAREAC